LKDNKTTVFPIRLLQQLNSNFGKLESTLGKMRNILVN